VSFLRTSLVALVLASISLLGCKSTEITEIGETANSLRGPKGARTPPSRATYYIAHRDTRRCSYPSCGGIFVSAANQTITRCADGSYAPECYVSAVDFSKFEGYADPEATVTDALGADFETTRVVLMGTMHPSILGFGTIRVQMAWIATEPQVITGNFYATFVNGIVCIVAPCPSYDQELLNRGSVVQFHGFDLQDVPAHADDSRFTGPALRSDYGMIVAGENVVDEHAGPGGQGTFLKASQVFIPLVSLGRNSIPVGIDPNGE
jgi:hypothetical protein